MARLIDADALMELVKRHGCDKCPGGALQCASCTLNQFIAMIESDPTLDAAPVRRGEWKLIYSTTVVGERWSIKAICSECFFEKDEIGSAEFQPGTPSDIALEAVRNIAKSLDVDNFCPHCGADMRGETNDTRQSL